MIYHFSLLISLAQFFLFLIQTGKADQLEIRSSSIQSVQDPKVTQKMKKFKRQGGRIGGSGASSNGMFCDGKTDRVADPRDCFRALQFLYTNFPQSGCAVSGSCAMMPVTFEYTPLVTNRPKYTFQQVQASYDGLFGYYCKNYRSPITVKSDWPKNAFLSGFLLGLNAGSGVRECDSSMSQRILQETKSFSGP